VSGFTVDCDNAIPDIIIIKNTNSFFIINYVLLAQVLMVPRLLFR
jgi:hypothetical protein